MSRPWMKFYPSDWRADPALRMCSIGARGFWMEMLCVMHEATPRGSLLINGVQVTRKQLAGLAGVPEKEAIGFLIELHAAGVFSTEENGTIYSRRMKRDEEKSERDKANGKGGGHPDIKRGTVPKDQRVRRFRRSDAPAKARRIFDRSSGACHWCQKPLDPEHYHIDHVVAVRDGGTNVESNLVASCPECNGERAMVWGRNDSDLMVGEHSDLKAQTLEARHQNPERKIGAFAPVGIGLKNGNGEAKGWTPPRHGATGKGRIYLHTGTPEWEAYAEDFRSTTLHDPEPNRHGGKWFKLLGEAS